MVPHLWQEDVSLSVDLLISVVHLSLTAAAATAT